MTLVLLLSAVVVCAVGGYTWSLARSLRELAFCSWRCPHCAQKLRYPAQQAGRRATCPGCKQRLTLPTAVQATSTEGDEVQDKGDAPRRPVGQPLRRVSARPSAFGR
jgi:hypothetical protein